jgi:nucleotide-binding universal stress UspA family protein
LSLLLYQVKLAAAASRKRGEIMQSTALNNILVAIDLSEATPDVIATAIMLNRTHSGKFWVVHADDSAPYLYPPENGDVLDPMTGDTQSNDADVVLAGIREQLSQAEMAAEFIRLEGPAAESILEKAREIEADLIVIGAHRHGRFYRMFFGDTGDELMRHAPCPVLVVPHEGEKTA